MTALSPIMTPKAGATANEIFQFYHSPTFMLTLLHTALVKVSHVGRSMSSMRTSSFSSRLDNSPSPFSVLNWILSGDRFLVNLKWNNSHVYHRAMVSYCFGMPISVGYFVCKSSSWPLEVSLVSQKLSPFQTKTKLIWRCHYASTKVRNLNVIHIAGSEFMGYRWWKQAAGFIMFGGNLRDLCSYLNSYRSAWLLLVDWTNEKTILAFNRD